MRSSEYFAPEKEQALIGACRDVDAKCVRLAGQSMDSVEASQAATFLPVIRECRGGGKGDCLEALFNTVTSHDRRTSEQGLALLRKCD